MSYVLHIYFMLCVKSVKNDALFFYREKFLSFFTQFETNFLLRIFLKLIMLKQLHCVLIPIMVV